MSFPCFRKSEKANVAKYGLKKRNLNATVVQFKLLLTSLIILICIFSGFSLAKYIKSEFDLKTESQHLIDPLVIEERNSIMYTKLFENTSTFKYIQQQEENGKSFPVLVICHQRAEILNQTLKSLKKARHANNSKILAVQDGTDKETEDVIRSNGVHLIQKTSRRRTLPDYSIARHYKFSIDKAFKHFPDSPAIIILEDDLLVSFDFLEYFSSVAPLVEADPSIFTASAWNDNGFQHAARNESRLLRTSFFPGLGWLLLRDEWKNTLRRTWAIKSWDWFVRAVAMRYPEKYELKDVIYPEVPRVFHIGREGSFVSEDIQEKYFDNIRFSNGQSRISKGEIILSVEKEYNKKFEERITTGFHLNDTNLDSINELPKMQPLVIWCNLDYLSKYLNLGPLMDKLGLWSQVLRGQRRGVYEFWFKDRKLIVINLFHQPGENKIIPEFNTDKDERQLPYISSLDESPWVHLKPREAVVYNFPRFLTRLQEIEKKNILTKHNLSRQKENPNKKESYLL
eukprot:snap_masked-scaffold_1-processed-gene-9.45-mRNA-1 protein AED:0.65 eAED:0.65 QI:0/-1/0/1/-1/1/1/0/511